MRPPRSFFDYLRWFPQKSVSSVTSTSIFHFTLDLGRVPHPRSPPKGFRALSWINLARVGVRGTGIALNKGEGGTRVQSFPPTMWTAH